MSLKPVHGYFGGPAPISIDNFEDPWGLEDTGMFMKTKKSQTTPNTDF
jgi:hypothetical protein